MNDHHVTEALLRFHLGASDDAEHAAVDAHLLECRACLGELLSLKRRFDAAAAFDERPSAQVRERLRAGVRRKLGLRVTRPRLFAAGAVALAAALLALAWFGRAKPAPHPVPRDTLIDTGSEARISQFF